MKALRLRGPGRLVPEIAPDPVPGPDETVLRVTHCAICRTDAKMYRDGHRDLTLPRIPGHEIRGEGPDGTAYAVWPGHACGHCPTCRSGAENLCPEMRIVGFHRDGGFAERVAVPRRSLLPLPPDLPGPVACLAEPLACAINGLDRAGVVRGDRVLVYGAGPVGLLLGLAARFRGASPAVREIRAGRLSESRAFRTRIGFPECGDGETGFHAAINAAPDSATVADGLSRLGPAGRFCLFSGLSTGEALSPSVLDIVHYRQLTVTGAYGCTRDGMGKALQILSESHKEAALLVEEAGTLGDVPGLLAAVWEGRGPRRVIRPA